VRLVQLVSALSLAAGLTAAPITLSSGRVSTNKACARFTCMTFAGFRCDGAAWPYDSDRCRLGTPGCIPRET